MLNENETKQSAEDQQPAATPQVVDAAMLSRAHHEGGHANVGDRLGGKVLWVNVGKTAGKKWEAKINWPQLVDMYATANDIMKVVVCIVAGPMAEKAVEHEVKPPTPVKLVSQMITKKNLEGEGPYETGDVDQTASLLRRIGRNTMQWVKEAEKLAGMALQERSPIQKALVEALMKHDGYIEGDILDTALGKKPNPPALDPKQPPPL